MDKPRLQLRTYTVLYVYGFALALVVLFVCCTGCSLLQPCPVDAPAGRFLDDYQDSRQQDSDGGPDITAGERHMLDRDAGFLESAFEEKSQRFQFPPTGNPLLDICLKVGEGLLVWGAAHKTVNWSRDHKRKKRGESVA